LPTSGIVGLIVVADIGIAHEFRMETTLPFAVVEVKVVAVGGIVEVELAVGVLEDEDAAAVIGLGVGGEGEGEKEREDEHCDHV
jgi:hypothetical protein